MQEKPLVKLNYSLFSCLGNTIAGLKVLASSKSMVA
jgi:hypothetical protein